MSRVLIFNAVKTSDFRRLESHRMIRTQTGRTSPAAIHTHNECICAEPDKVPVGVAPCHDVQAFRELRQFLISTLDGDQWLASRSSCFTPADWMRPWVDTKPVWTGSPCLRSNPDRPPHSYRVRIWEVPGLILGFPRMNFCVVSFRPNTHTFQSCSNHVPIAVANSCSRQKYVKYTRKACDFQSNDFKRHAMKSIPTKDSERQIGRLDKLYGVKNRSRCHWKCLSSEMLHLADIDRRFREAVSITALIMEAVSSSETSANIYQTIRWNIREGNRIQVTGCH
jgi:hypothetical protein